MKTTVPIRKNRWATAAFAAGTLIAGLLMNAPAQAITETGKAGPCAGDEGVTVVVDFGAYGVEREGAPTGDKVVVRCALGAQSSGVAALVNAGFTPGIFNSQPPGTVKVPGPPGATGALCTIESVPSTNQAARCWSTGFWRYYNAASTTATSWSFSNTGASSSKPALGSVEGWWFGLFSESKAGPLRGPAFPDRPIDPAKPTVSVAGSKVDVNWAAPADAGSVVTGYTVTLTPETGAPLTKTVGNVTSASFTAVPAGTYAATVLALNAIGSSDASAVSDSVTVEPAIVTTVTATVGQVVYGQAGQVQVAVAAQTGEAKPSGTVSTTIGSSTISSVLTDGAATLTLPAKSLKPGATVLPISYGGVEGDFTASSTTVSVNVAKAASTVKVSGPKKVKRGKTAKFTVSVASAAATPAGKVTVRVAGVTKTVTPNANGKAVIKVKVAKNAKPGVKVVTVSYSGNSYVASAKNSTKVKVTK